MGSFWKGVTAFCVVSWIIVTIGLIAGSFAVITPLQLGLLYNAVTVTFDDSGVHTSGRIYVGVGGSFFLYPRNYQYVEFSTANGNALDVWSADGQQIFVEASFYYKLQEAHIVDLFYLYGANFNTIITGQAAESIRDTAVQYQTLDFFTNRTGIDQQMSAALALKLASTNTYTDMTLFNLLAIDVPSSFDAAVESKVLTGQAVITQDQLRQSQLLQTQIAVIGATANASVTVIVANATATGSIITTQASADTLVQYMVARGAALAQVSSSLGFTSAQQLLQYIYTDIIRGNTNTTPTLAINFADGIVGS